MLNGDMEAAPAVAPIMKRLKAAYEAKAQYEQLIHQHERKLNELHTNLIKTTGAIEGLEILVTDVLNIDPEATEKAPADEPKPQEE